MDEQLILDTAEAAAPALRALATEILQAEAAHLGVSLDAADVLLRRAEGGPAVHVAAAEWPPWAVRFVRIISLSWSPVTESNRRPSPYHGKSS